MQMSVLFFFQPFNKGFFMGLGFKDNFIGVNTSFGYLVEQKTLQLYIQIANVYLCTGWKF